MIEEALINHLKAQTPLTDYLTTYADQPAIFYQEAPADVDSLWATGPQYGRIVFTEDLQGDPERIMGGTLVVDIYCKENQQFPEDIEPILRELIHGYFFSNGTFTAAAKWNRSDYFTEPTNQVTGCTLSFELLAFPLLSTDEPDVIGRLNEWTSRIGEKVYAINKDPLPNCAWKPSNGEAAIYWRVAAENPAGRIPDTYHTIWRTATVKGHIFAQEMFDQSMIARDIRTRLYAEKRLLKSGEAPIMVNAKISIDDGADALRTGQMTVDATYGIIVRIKSNKMLEHINKQRKENL